MSIYNGEEGIDMSSWFFYLSRSEDEEGKKKGGRNE